MAFLHQRPQLLPGSLLKLELLWVLLTGLSGCRFKQEEKCCDQGSRECRGSKERGIQPSQAGEGGADNQQNISLQASKSATLQLMIKTINFPYV